MFRIFPLFFFVCGAFGQITLEGECNFAEADYIENLNLSQIIGTWHQIARIDNIQEIGDCSTLTFFKVNGSDETQFSQSEIYNKTKITTNGTIQEAEESPGWLTMNFQNNITLDFVMLTTNHTGVAVIYSCTNFQNSTKEVWAWQYHRNATLSTDEKAVIDVIVSNHPDLANATWRETNQNSTICPVDDGNSGVRLPIPHILTILAFVFLAKEFL